MFLRNCLTPTCSWLSCLYCLPLLSGLYCLTPTCSWLTRLCRPSPGDTLFIVLRKQRLIFLHWYHHITVLLYSWYSYKDMVAGGGWFMTMNYLVHALMYSYYAARAAGFRVSRRLAMFITLTQISQMVVGCVVNYLVYSWMQRGAGCPSHVHNIVWSSLMYLSYFLLFLHFFYEAYVGKNKPPASASTVTATTITTTTTDAKKSQ